MTNSRIVIVGAGQAGGNVAVGLREEGYTGEVVLLGDEADVPYGRPPLSKTYLRGEEDVSEWFVKPREWYAEHDISLRTSALVQGVDPAGGRVLLSDGNDMRCDAVCIATGCRPRRLRVPGTDLSGIHVLRTRRDADEIRAAITPGAKAVVVGMGFIGAEVTASLRQMSIDVSTIFVGDAPLASVLGGEVGSAIAQMHREKGVELIAGETVAGFVGNKSVEAVVTDSGRSVDCTFVVLGVGVAPNVELLEGSGVAVDNGVIVDAVCRTNVANVFAAGDVASHDHRVFGRTRIEHFNNAERQGQHVARAMLGSPEPYDYVHSFWSDQYDEKIEYVGHANEWDDFVVRGDLDGRSFLGLYLKDGRIRAAVGVNRGGDPDGDPESELAELARLIVDEAAVGPTAFVEGDRKPGE